MAPFSPFHTTVPGYDHANPAAVALQDVGTVRGVACNRAGCREVASACRSEGTGSGEGLAPDVGGVGPIALQQPRQRHVRGQGDAEVAHAIEELVLPGYPTLSRARAQC